MKKIVIGGVLSLICTSLFAQSCFTNCMNFQSNNPNAGAICSTNCGGGGGNGVNLMESFRQGAESVQRLQESEMRSQMIRDAKQACNQGNQQACTDLRSMLFR